MKQSTAMLRGYIAVLAAGLALTTWQRGAVAGDRVGVAIEWSVDPSARDCADAVRLRSEVAAQVRRNAVVDARVAHALISGRTTRDGNQWHAAISLRRLDGTEMGRRDLDETGTNCADLDRALVVVLAMMIDATVIEDTSVVQADAPELPPWSGRTALPPRDGWRIAAASGLVGELGRLPGTGLGVELGVAVRVAPDWSLEGTAVGWRMQTATSGTVGTRMRQIGGSLVACTQAWTHAPMRIVGCAGLHLGSISSGGYGFVENRQQRAWLIDGRADLRLEWRVLDEWFVRVGTGLWVPAERPVFSWQDSVGKQVALYEPASVAAIGQIGVGVRFR